MAGNVENQGVRRGEVWRDCCKENDLMDAGQWEVLRIRELGNG